MREIDYGSVISLISKYDTASNDAGAAAADVATELTTALEHHFAGAEQKMAVLGIDIYRYSGYAAEVQRLIPSIFRFLYELAVKICTSREEFLFQRHSFEGHFISTGDGGFLLFDTPLHALIFATYFQSVMVWFNGYIIFPRLRQLVGSISLRYAVTYDTAFRQDGSYYGSAIISNARILSRDSLNRCLIDGEVVEWFNRNVANVEALMTLTRDRLATLPVFAHYEQKESSSLLFTNSEYILDSPFKSIHLQKVGVVTAKQSQHDVYNLCMQVNIVRNVGEGALRRDIIVTVGNLNVTGISA